MKGKRKEGEKRRKKGGKGEKRGEKGGGEKEEKERKNQYGEELGQNLILKGVGKDVFSPQSVQYPLGVKNIILEREERK